MDECIKAKCFSDDDKDVERLIENNKMDLAESVNTATPGIIDNKRFSVADGANLPKSDNIYDSTFSSVENDKNSNSILENSQNVSSVGVLSPDVSANSGMCNVALDNSIKNDTVNNNGVSTKTADDNDATIQKAAKSGAENSAARNDEDILKQMRSTSVQIVPNSNIRTISNSNIQTVPNSNIQNVPNSNIQSVPNQNMHRPCVQSLGSVSIQPTRHPTVQQAAKNAPQIPIIGYEVMEERARFTIYKLRVDDPRTALSWLVFRRYTDFVRLHSKLKASRNILFPLPEKRLFKDNFDPAFLDNRVRGLQTFVNAVMRTLPNEPCVREFFCLDEPPPAVGDSEPEAQALFGALEDTVGALRDQIRQKEEALEYLRRKVFYLEERSRSCLTCNPTVGSPDSSGSSNGS